MLDELEKEGYIKRLPVERAEKLVYEIERMLKRNSK